MAMLEFEFYVLTWWCVGEVGTQAVGLCIHPLSFSDWVRDLKSQCPKGMVGEPQCEAGGQGDTMNFEAYFFVAVQFFPDT